MVYVDERDIVWLSDFGGKFTTYRKSTENADVRQTNGRRGEVWLPESRADRLVVIRTIPPSEAAGRSRCFIGASLDCP